MNHNIAVDGDNPVGGITLRATLESCGLHSGDRVIVGLSGGADSVALLVWLREQGVATVAAHVNYGLRDDESLRDERFCRALCADMDVPLEVMTADIAGYRAAHSDMSVEMACREVRYQWFEKLRASRLAVAIAVAHHREDNAETFVLNLMRGCGIAGLRGMKWRAGDVVRPLLEVTKEEILEFLADRGIGYVTDSTNAQNIYKRNRVRNTLLPAVRGCFPEADDALMRTQRLLRRQDAFITEAMTRARAAATTAYGGIDLRELSRCWSDPSLLIYAWYADDGISARQSEDIINARSGSRFPLRSGKELLVHGGVLYEFGTLAYNEPAMDDASVDDVSGLFRFEEVEGTPDFANKPSNAEYFDVGVMADNPVWAVRHWQHGDRMTPLGMRGSRKLSDIFVDCKIPGFAKDRLDILTRDGEILWIPGVRRSNAFAVRRDALKYISIVYVGKNV